MLAALFQKANMPLEIKEVGRPTCSSSEVLVKIENCGICHTDISIYSGRYPARKASPLILGHEIAGKVEEIGGEVKNLEKGDRVSVSPLITCGECFYCSRGLSNLCCNAKNLGIDVDGGFAEYISVPKENIFELPSQVSLKEGSLMEPTSVCLRAVQKLQTENGDNVALFGVGGLGSIILQLLVNIYGVRVIAIDAVKEKLSIAKDLGARWVLNATELDPAQKIKSITRGRGADYAIEAVGLPKVQDEAIRSVRKGGKAVIIGTSDSPIKINPKRLFKEEVEVTGSYGFSKSDFSNSIELADMERIDLKRVITHQFGLEKINRAFEVKRGKRDVKKQPIKILIRPHDTNITPK